MLDIMIKRLFLNPLWKNLQSLKILPLVLLLNPGCQLIPKCALTTETQVLVQQQLTQEKVIPEMKAINLQIPQKKTSLRVSTINNLDTNSNFSDFINSLGCVYQCNYYF